MKFLRRLILVVAVVALIALAFIFGRNLIGGEQETSIALTQPEPVSAAVDTEPEAASVETEPEAAPDEQAEQTNVLVWTAQGFSDPSRLDAANPGQLALVNEAGGLTPLLNLPAGTSTVQACGERSASADGEYFALYTGNLESGSLHLMTGTNPPVVIDEVLRLACLGAGTFAFSPDGGRFAYIDYEPGSGTDEFADGFLKVYDPAAGSELFSTESVTAFDINDDDVAFVSFFTNDQNEADEAAVLLWDGSNDREVATLMPDNTEDTGECKFVSASVNILPDGNLSLVMGQRCDRTGTTSWQLYTVNVEERSATRAATEPVTGGYQSFARTNVQYSAPDGSTFLFTVPDGVTANTVGLFSVAMNDLTPMPLLERQMVMPANTTPANATPAISPDGRWLAAVQTSPNSDNALLIYDLSDLSLDPTNYSAGSTGDTVSALSFTGDSTQVVAVAGGDNQANNSVIAFNVESGSDFRVDRGRFSSDMVISADGTKLAVGDWQILEDPNEPPFLNLISITIADSASATLYEGAVVENGEVIEQSFAVPLAWR